jgi:hypothetical protein
MNNQDTSSSPTEPPSQSNSLAEEPPAKRAAEVLPLNLLMMIVFLKRVALSENSIQFTISGGDHVRFF